MMHGGKPPKTIMQRYKLKGIQDISCFVFKPLSSFHSFIRAERESALQRKTVWEWLQASDSLGLLSFQDHLPDTVLSEPHLHAWTRRVFLVFFHIPQTLWKQEPNAACYWHVRSHKGTPAAPPRFIVFLSTSVFAAYFVKLCKYFFSHSQHRNAVERERARRGFFHCLIVTGCL